MKGRFRKIGQRVAYLKEYAAFKALSSQTAERFPLLWGNRYPCLDDKTTATGFDRHYIYHPAWAARVLAQTKPAQHIDISSTLHFCSIVSAFIPVEFYDFRPADVHLSNFTSKSADLLALPFNDRSIASLSCMHVVEHMGLGRYGDQIDPDGDLKAVSELKRVLAVGGTLLFVVPIGKPRILFNAHRIYSYAQIAGYFSDLELHEFTLIPEDPRHGGLICNATKEMIEKQGYGCGCFWFVRRA
jgi:SAM-dependent methyltransferase